MRFDSKWVNGDCYAIYDVLGFGTTNRTQHLVPLVWLVRRHDACFPRERSKGLSHELAVSEQSRQLMRPAQ